MRQFSIRLNAIERPRGCSFVLTKRAKWRTVCCLRFEASEFLRSPEDLRRKQNNRPKAEETWRREYAESAAETARSRRVGEVRAGTVDRADLGLRVPGS